MPKQYNTYATGIKHYGGGRSAPNIGKTGKPEGYVNRTINNKAKHRKQILVQRLQKLRGK